MKLLTRIQAENTREKLDMLAAQRKETAGKAGKSEFVRAATLRSLTRLINQLKEELAWYESRQGESNACGESSETITPASKSRPER